MDTIIELRLHSNGALTTVSDGGDVLGNQRETGARKVRIDLPNELYGKEHYLEFAKPSGTRLSSTQLTELTDSDGIHYIEVTVGTNLTDEVGRYLIQYVARYTDNSNNRVIFKSGTKALEIEESINAGQIVDEATDDLVSWVKEEIAEMEGDVDTATERANAAATSANNAATEAHEAAEAATEAAAGLEHAEEVAAEAKSIAQTANGKSDNAVATASSANTVAGEAKTIAQTAETKADNAVSTANNASSAASGAVTTANGAVTTANAAKTTAEAVQGEVEDLFTNKKGIANKYGRLENIKVGTTVSFHVKGNASSNAVMKCFVGKNIFNVAGLNVSGDNAQHPSCAYGPFVCPTSIKLAYTLPDDYKLYIRATNNEAYLSTEGALIAEISLTGVGAITLPAAAVNKSIRFFLTHLVDGNETLPTASELQSLVGETQIEYGEQPTSHVDYIPPVQLGTIVGAGEHDYTLTATASSIGFALVPANDSAGGAVLAPTEDNYNNSWYSYLTSDVGNQIISNKNKNDEQDVQIASLREDVDALIANSGNEVYAIQFTGSSPNGVRLLSSQGKVFDLSQNRNDFESTPLFLKIYEVEKNALDSNGNQLYESDGVTPKKCYFMHFPNVYVKFTSILNSDNQRVETTFVSLNARSGYEPVFKNADGSVPEGCLIGMYRTAWNHDKTYAGPFKGARPVVNRDRNAVYNVSPYIKDDSLGIELQRIHPCMPLKAWNLLTYLFQVVVGTNNAQDVFKGITSDGLFDPLDSAVASLQPSSAANTVVIPTSNYLVTKLSVGDSFGCLINGATHWETRKVTAKTADTPSSGYTTITFDGDPILWTGTCRISYAAGKLTGSTDNIPGFFGNVSNDGYGSSKIFGIENWYGEFWNILEGAAIYQTWDADNNVGINTVYKPVGDDYTAQEGLSYSNFVATDLKLPITNGYVKEVQFEDGYLVPESLGGSTTTYKCDYYYTDARTSAGTAWRMFMGGGHFDSGGYAGPFSFDCADGWADGAWSCGFRSFVLCQGQ